MLSNYITIAFRSLLKNRFFTGLNILGLAEEYTLQPLSDIYLHSNRRYEIADNGNAANLYIFGTVGWLILFLAGINYVNMATASASQYARSVGVRKTFGAQRGQLAWQFVVESVSTALLAVLLAVLLALAFSGLCQPVFERLTGKALGIFDVPALPVLMVGMALLLGLTAGAYPAFVLSGFRPAAVLKGNLNAAAGSTGIASLRKVLVVTQFSISIALIVSVLVIRGQMDFIKTKNLGYDKDTLLALKVNGEQSVIDGIEAFRNEVTAQPALIRGMTFANTLPIGGTGNNGATTIDNKGKQIQSATYRYRVDYDYADVFGLKFRAGRNFSRRFPADAPTDSTQNYILNEAAVKAFGWETPELAIGKPFQMNGRKGQVIGIVQDFHFNSLKHQVEPLAMHLTTTRFSQIVLRVDMDHASLAIAEMEATWKKHFPDAYLAGVYPALFASRFRPVEVFQKNSPVGASGAGQWLRKSLITIQFAVSIALLCGTLIMLSQLRYWQNMPLGFDAEQIITVPLSSDNLNSVFSPGDSTLRRRMNAFDEVLLQNPGVTEVMPTVQKIVEHVKEKQAFYAK